MLLSKKIFYFIIISCASLTEAMPYFKLKDEIKKISLIELTQTPHLTPALSYIGEGAKFPPDVGGIKGGSFDIRLTHRTQNG
jgi:hypothetical protein